MFTLLSGPVALRLLAQYPISVASIMLVFPGEGRELGIKSEGKFKSWESLKVMKKASAWVVHNRISASGFTEGIRKQRTTLFSLREGDNNAGLVFKLQRSRLSST